ELNPFYYLTPNTTTAPCCFGGAFADAFNNYRRLAQYGQDAGSGFPHQVDVPDSYGADAWRSRDVESCFHDAAAVPVRCARGRRSAQAASCCSVVFGSCRAIVDREIQSSASSSEPGETRSPRDRSWFS